MTRQRSRPVLSRKHFQAISSAVAGMRGGNLRERVARTLVPALREFNPSFNEELFVNQCNGNFTRRASRRIGSVVNEAIPPNAPTLQENLVHNEWSFTPTSNRPTQRPWASYTDGRLIDIGRNNSSSQWKFRNGVERGRIVSDDELMHCVLFEARPEITMGVINFYNFSRWAVEAIYDDAEDRWVYAYVCSGLPINPMTDIHVDHDGHSYVAVSPGTPPILG